MVLSRTKNRLAPLLELAVSAFLFMNHALLAAEADIHWRQLPPLPDPLGVAGAFAGVSGGALVVAGGANFPGKMPWEGGVKVWHDTAYVLENTNAAWRGPFKIPCPLGYGVSVTTREGVVCLGGSDATRHFPDGFILSWTNGRLQSIPLPRLPTPLANACGAVVGRMLYVAGGTATPDSTHALRAFWALDLDRPAGAWRELDPWPGPARMLAVAAVVGSTFYLAGGADLHPDAEGKPVRTYLQDAYRFTAREGWRRVADMPNPVVAAPTPAPVTDDVCFLMIGGDDGSQQQFMPKSQHPGFPRRVLSYDTRIDRWRVIADLPAPRATLPAVLWNGLWVMPSGEARPGVRSPEVWAVALNEPR